MRNTIAFLVMFCVVAVSFGCATTQQRGLADIVSDGCKAEINSFCKDVTPGEARVLACLYAHEDKLSNRCEYALYDAVTELQHAVEALSYAANECRDDLRTYWSDINPGGGRLVDCLDRNQDKISARCKQAQKDIGLK